MKLAAVTNITALSPVILKDAACGLAQQMVFWGHDVRHPDGNSLVRSGMKRTPSPGLAGTSCYSLEWENGRLELHGAVASWTAPGNGTGMAFCRDKCQIALWHGPNSPIPGREHGIEGEVSQRWDAFQPFLRWLISYEKWILETHGPEWRAACWRTLKRLPKGKPWLSPATAMEWWELAASSIPPRPKHLAKH